MGRTTYKFHRLKCDKCDNTIKKLLSNDEIEKQVCEKCNSNMNLIEEDNNEKSYNIRSLDRIEVKANQVPSWLNDKFKNINQRNRENLINTK